MDNSPFSSSSKPKKPRLPPGQYLAKKWPVLSIERPPGFDGKNWDITITGLVANPVTLSWDEFTKLPQKTITNDIHCVTSWSLVDQTFSGVPFQVLMDIVNPLPEAKYATFQAHSEYTSALPLYDGYLDDPSVILATHYEGKPLPVKHGGPVRLLVPHLYFWKSVKWVTKITLTREWERGFWEQRGYHIRGNPWNEERYSTQE